MYVSFKPVVNFQIQGQNLLLSSGCTANIHPHLSVLTSATQEICPQKDHITSNILEVCTDYHQSICLYHEFLPNR